MSASFASRATTASSGPIGDSSPGQGEFPWRVLGLLNAFRFFIGLTLLLIFAVVREPRIIGEAEPVAAATILILMIAFAPLSLFMIRRRWPKPLLQTYIHFTFDLVTLVILLHSSGGIVSNIGGLIIVSVGALALLVPLDRALFLAAVATFVLLGEQALSMTRGFTESSHFLATGILAAAIFVITGIAQLLRKQMVETQALAAQRGVDLRSQVELNQYIVQHLRESIVAVDRDNIIRLINESAARLLGTDSDVVDGPLREIASDLELRLNEWREGLSPITHATLVLEKDQSGAKIEPHFVRLGPDRRGGVVIFLEDTSLIFERVQQTKLAALGRLSASIAHEIRNPLGALSHAGQLLAESESIGPEEQRLTDIIRTNSGRVSQIVESVLSLSRSDKTRPQKIPLKAWLEDFADEFTATQELYEETISVHPDSLQVEAEMDRTHLHQVLWNLCENAVKYASETAGAISVELLCGRLESSGRPFIDVIDSGPGIESDLAEQIFEPFYTAQSGGTGLGLYISRELCDRNGASLRYIRRSEGGSIFRVAFSDPNRWTSD